jgi:hypothetical protein
MLLSVYAVGFLCHKHRKEAKEPTSQAKESYSPMHQKATSKHSSRSVYATVFNFLVCKGKTVCEVENVVSI